MAALVISTKKIEPQEITVESMSDNLTIDKKGSVVINLKGEYDPANDEEYAVLSTTNSTVTNTITLNGAISITDKTTDGEAHNTFGLYAEQAATTGTEELPIIYTAIIKTDNASTIKVTRDTKTSAGKKGIIQENVYGIYGTLDYYNYTNLEFSTTFLDAITIAATNSNKEDGAFIFAVGIYAKGVVFNEDIAAAIKVTGTGKSNAVNACGIYSSSNAAIKGNITKDITVTATGVAAAAQKSTCAAAIYINNELAIGTEDDEANIAGKITAKATGNAVLSADKSKGDGNISMAYGIVTSSTLTINGSITKDITVTSTANSVKLNDKTAVSGSADAYGINADQKLTIDGVVSGAIKATATAKANAAFAYGIACNSKEISITDGITKDITVSATGTADVNATEEESRGTMTTAVAIYAGENLTIGTEDDDADIAGKITAKATGSAALTADKSTGYAGNATAYAIQGTSITINGDITKAISANATANSVKTSDGTVVCGSASASCFNATSAITITGDITGSITATANSKGQGDGAKGIVVSAGNLSIEGAIKATVTAKATTAGNNSAIGIQVGEGNATIGKGVMKDIVATSSAESMAVAYGLYVSAGNPTTDVKLTIGATKDTAKGTNYAINGAITATAKATAGNSRAYAIGCKYIEVNGSINKKISVTSTATGDGGKKSNSTIAYGFVANSSLTITNDVKDTKGAINAITADIVVKSTGNAKYYKDTAVTTTVDATAAAMFAMNDVIVNGDITKNITVSATSNTVKVGSTVTGGFARAYGINGPNTDLSNCDILGKITVTSTCKGVASTVNHFAMGIFANTALKLKNTFGTISVTLTDNVTITTNSKAFGIRTTNLTYNSDDHLTGKITVSNKLGKATGIEFASFKDKEGEGGSMSVNISVTGKEAVGINIKNTAYMPTCTIVDSKITAKTTDKTNGSAIALTTTEATYRQSIELSNSTVVGDVEMGQYNSGLTLLDKSKITGDIDMGEGTDTVAIHTGSQIKGNVENANIWNMFLDDASSKGVAMWEGAEFEETADQAYNLSIYSAAISGIKSGKSMVFTLMKDTDNSHVAWTDATKVKINFAETYTSLELYYNGDAVESGGYSFELDGIEKGKTTTMQLTVTKLA